MNRRRFLTGIAGMLAAGQAAAILPASSIMRVKAIVLPDTYRIVNGGLYGSILLHDCELNLFVRNDSRDQLTVRINDRRVLVPANSTVLLKPDLFRNN
jgi:dUTPase